MLLNFWILSMALTCFKNSITIFLLTKNTALVQKEKTSPMQAQWTLEAFVAIFFLTCT